MKSKNAIAGALLIFVVASLAILIGREMREPKKIEVAPTIEELPKNGLLVYYFHGETRCPTCRNIESYSQEAVQAAFAEDLAQHKLLWKVVNYEQPENSHFASEYEIVSPTVVLVRIVDGYETDWRNLGRVWELVGDREAFTEYIQCEVRSMLAS